MEKAKKIANAKLRVWTISTQNMCKNTQNLLKLAKITKMLQKKANKLLKTRENK